MSLLMFFLHVFGVFPLCPVFFLISMFLLCPFHCNEYIFSSYFFLVSWMAVDSLVGIDFHMLGGGRGIEARWEADKRMPGLVHVVVVGKCNVS